MRLVLIAACALGMVSTTASAAPVITFSQGMGGNAAGTTVFQNFDGFAAGSRISTFTDVYAVSNSKGAEPAFGSTGNFAAILGGGTYSVMFDASSVFSFVLGSLDRYNKLTLSFSDGTSRVYNGGEIIGGGSYPAGNQASPGSNGLVTIKAIGSQFLTGATFQSQTNSFEIDNMAISAVPEPSTWAFMTLGLGVIGATVRRRKARNVVAA